MPHNVPFFPGLQSEEFYLSRYVADKLVRRRGAPSHGWNQRLRRRDEITKTELANLVSSPEYASWQSNRERQTARKSRNGVVKKILLVLLVVTGAYVLSHKDTGVLC